MSTLDVPALAFPSLSRIVSIMKAAMKNLFKASNMSAVVATLVAAAELEGRAATRPENTTT